MLQGSGDSATSTSTTTEGSFAKRVLCDLDAAAVQPKGAEHKEHGVVVRSTQDPCVANCCTVPSIQDQPRVSLKLRFVPLHWGTEEACRVVAGEVDDDTPRASGALQWYRCC